MKLAVLHNVLEVHLDPTRTFCPKPHCDGVCQISNGRRRGQLSAAAGPQPVLCASVSLVISDIVDARQCSCFVVSGYLS